MNKFRLVTIVLTVIGLLFGLSALAAAAGSTNMDAAHALPIGSQSITFPANSDLWYAFGYAGDRSTITVQFVNGNTNHLAFNIWTPQQVADLTGENPIGRGTTLSVDCDTGVIRKGTTCNSADLFWQGNFNAPGTYYVEVLNPGSNAATAQILVKGSGVSAAAGPAAAGPAVAGSVPSNQGGAAVPPASQPSNQGGATNPITVTNPTNIDLQHALPTTNQAFTIPSNPNGALWFSFNYAGDRSDITVQLVNGSSAGLLFDVWTPTQALDFTNEHPIGRGTAMGVSCDNGQPRPNSTCTSSDLFWTGNFFAPGTYYVEVFNPTANSVATQLIISGSGVSRTGAPTTSTSAPSTTTSTSTNLGVASKPAAVGNPTNIDLQHAVPISNQTITIPANANGALWYRFMYAGDRSDINVRLVNGNTPGLSFEVWTPTQAAAMTDEHAIGKGTSMGVNCDNGQPRPNSPCTSPDLFWTGSFFAPGTYYVEVFNSTANPVTTPLVITGSGVSLK